MCMSIIVYIYIYIYIYIEREREREREIPEITTDNLQKLHLIGKYH